MTNSFGKQNKLLLGVQLKENQSLKYLNLDSQHTQPTFKAIPPGVLQRLSKLTTLTEENENVTIDKVYPKHTKALTKAKLVLEFPTVGDLKRTPVAEETKNSQ